MQGYTDTAALKMCATSDSEPTMDPDLPFSERGRKKRFIRRPEDITKCLEKGSDVNAVNGKGNTLLHIAIKNGDVENVQLLLEKGAKKDIPNHKGLTSLTLAESINSNHEINRLLTTRGAEGDERGRQYEIMILMLFFKRGHFGKIFFSLGKQVAKAGKFDDVIFRFKDCQGKDQYRFLQAKNIRDDTKEITSTNLLAEQPCTKKDDFLSEYFNLQKYFVSFRGICDDYGSDSVKDVIIFTNIGFDENELREYGIHLDEVIESDELLNLNAPTRKSSRYRFRVEEHCKLYQVLKDTSDSKMLAKEFLKHVFDENENTRVMRTQDNPIFSKYHVALAREVVDTKKGILKIGFIKGENLSGEVEHFRETLLNVGLKGDEKMFWRRIAEAKLKLGKSFGKELRGETYVKLPTDAIKDKEVRDFLDHLIFAVNQPNSLEMKSLLETEMKREFNLINTDFVMSGLQSTILSWVNEKKDKEGWVSWVKSREFFEKAKHGIVASQVAGITLEYERTILNFGIKYKTYIAGLQDFLLSGENKVFLIIASVETLFLVSIKLCQFLENSEDYRASDSHISVALESLLDEKIARNIMEAFSLTRNNLMIVRCDSSHPKHDIEGLCNQLITVVNGNSNKKLLLIGSSENAFVSLFKEKCDGYCEEEDTQIGYKYLSIESQEKMRNVEVIFQGNKVELTDLIDDHSESVIDTSTLIKLIKNIDIAVGSKIESLCYSPAAFFQVSEDISLDNLTEVFQKHLDDFIIFLTYQHRESLIRASEDESNEFSVANSEIIANISKHFNKERVFLQRAMNMHDNLDQFRQFCKDYSCMTIYWVNIQRRNIQWKQVYYPKFYIQRHFNYKEEVIIRKDIKKHLIWEIDSEMFIFSGISTFEELADIFELTEEENASIKLESIHLKSSDTEAENCFDEMIRTRKEVHWIKVERGFLIWKRSSGSLKILRDHLDEEKSKSVILKEDEFAEKMKDKVVILADEPGMGKSTTLISLSGLIKQRNQSDWIFLVILRNCEKAIISIPNKEKVSMKDAMAFFSNIDSLGLNTPLALRLMQHNLEPKMKRSFYVLFDGFDEINEAQQDRLVKLLRFLKDETSVKTWVCTRPYRADKLEDNLSVFAARLEELSDIERKEFLREFWRVRLSPSLERSKFTEVFPPDGRESKRFANYCQTLLDVVEKSLKRQTFRFMGIPLQLRMLAEVFQKEFLNYILANIHEAPTFQDFDSLHLYDRLFQTKCDIYFKEKLNLSDDVYVKKSLIKRLTKDHRLLAFSLLFPHSTYLETFLGNSKSLSVEKLNGMKSLGLVQSVGRDGKPYFIHQTFAEYFCAGFFTYILNNECRKETQYESLMRFLSEWNFKTENKVLFYFLDLMLVQNLPVHLAAMVEDDLRIENISVKDANAVDMLGRTALHLAARRGNPQVFETLLLFANDIKQQDKLGRTTLHYAAVFGHLHLLTSLLVLFLTTEVFDDSESHDLRKRVSFKNMCFIRLILMNMFFKIINNKRPLKHSVEYEKEFEVQEYIKNINDAFPSYARFINCRDKYEKSALHYALEGEHLVFAIRLIFQGAEIYDISEKVASHLSRHLRVTKPHLTIFPEELKDRPQYQTKPLELHLYFNKLNRYAVDVIERQLRVPDAIVRYDNGHEFNLMSCNVRRGIDIISNLMKSVGNEEKVRWLQENIKIFGIYPRYGIEREFCTTSHHLPKQVLFLSGNPANKVNETVKKIGFGNKVIASSLELASMRGQIEIFEHLFESLAEKSCHLYLYAAARNNQLDFVKYLWGKYSKYTTDQGGNTALHATCHGGIGGVSIRIIEHLIENGCDVNCRNIYWQTPLHMATSSDQRLPVVKYLVEIGANVHAVDKFGATPLHYAIKNVQLKIIRYLILNCGCSVETSSDKSVHVAGLSRFWMDLILAYTFKEDTLSFRPSIDQVSFFREAIRFRDEEFTAFVAKKLRNVRSLCAFGDTALHQTVKSNDTEMTRMLLQHRHSYNKKNRQRKTPLDLATDENSRLLTLVDKCFKNVATLEEVFQEMCIPGDDIFSTGVATARNADKRTILHLIAQCNAINAMKYLFECHLSFCQHLTAKRKSNAESNRAEYLNAKSVSGDTALHIAARNGHVEIARYLLNSGAIFNVKNNSGQSPIELAKCSHNAAMIDLLQTYKSLFLALKQNRKREVKRFLGNEKWWIKAVDENRMSVLHWAARNDWLEIVQLSLKQGADIECLDNHSCTPLHHAAEANHPRVVKLLLQNGAVFNAENEKECTALDLAKDECSDFLKSIHALFHHVHRDPHLVITKLEIFKKKPDDFCAAIHTRDDQFNTILHYAAKEDYFEVVTFLLKHEAPYYVKNKWSQTPKDLAHHQHVRQLFEPCNNLR